ncbi:hypothetical protein IMAU10117_03037 [Lactiplantibacillus plantarum]|nr:hypothetical protein [Lactiplantibacillus plantarum]
MSITMEDNYVYSSADMGDSHVKAHAKQHNYMQDNEPEIIMLNNNSALNVAIDNGVKTKDEWIKYNSKLRKGRQKKNYDEYLRALSANLLKNKKRYVQASHKVPLSKAKKQMTYQEINSIEKNKLGVTGNLFYLSNVDDYEKQTDLKKYRKFEKDTFETFYNSDTFKKLHPQNFKSEIDLDEKGAMHLQTGDDWMYTDGKGRVSSARRKIIKDILINDLGSEDVLNKQLDVLSNCHKYVKGQTQKKEGTLRADAVFAELLEQNNGDLSKFDCPKARASERSVRIEELWRLKNMWALKDIAKQKAKQYGVNYDIKDSMYYKTDGVHRSASEYETQQSVKKKSKDLDTQKEEVAEKERSAQEQINKALALQAKAEHDRKELEKRKKKFEEYKKEEKKRLKQKEESLFDREQDIKNHDKVFKGTLLDILEPDMDSLKRDDLINNVNVFVTVKTVTGKIEKQVMTFAKYIGRKVDSLKKVRSNSSEPVAKRRSADEKLASVQHAIVEHGQDNENIDWNARFGIDPTKIAKPVNNVKKQDSHKKVQQNDDLEL